jgi:FtsP/CotA-like multicopper oxidase with cupredoxin domain
MRTHTCGTARFRHQALRMLGVLLLIAGCDNPTRVSDPNFQATGRYQPRTRTYYVAAEAVNWNYAPLGTDPVFGQALPDPWGAQTVYPKVRYVGYTDGSFTTPVPAPADRGILGPQIRAVVGDTIKVVFHNATSEPQSMHPHGVKYAPEDEGAVYNPPRGGGDAVPPGGTYTYTWFARPESGPIRVSPTGPLQGEPSSKVWLYHGHVLADADIYKGLIGTITVTDPLYARDDGSPNDVDREFTTLWLVFNENTPDTPEELQEGNLKHAINGEFFGSLTGLTMNVGDRVRWYLVGLGTEVDVHTPHWHGAVVKVEGRSYTDVVSLMPAIMKVADMIADNPGTWLLHCHVADHMMAGMYTTFTIGSPAATATLDMEAQRASPGWLGFHDGMMRH